MKKRVKRETQGPITKVLFFCVWEDNNLERSVLSINSIVVCHKSKNVKCAFMFNFIANHQKKSNDVNECVAIKFIIYNALVLFVTIYSSKYLLI